MLDSVADVVANAPDAVEVEVRRIIQFPVEIPLARVERAGVTASHGHYRVGCPHDIVRQWLGELVRDVESDLSEHERNRRQNACARLRSGRAHMDAVTSELAGEGSCDLRSAGVLHADEKHFGNSLDDEPSGLCEGRQAVSGELLGETRQMRPDCRGSRQRRVGLEDDPFRGLLVHHSGELVGESLGGTVQHRIGGQQGVLHSTAGHAVPLAGTRSARSASMRPRISSRMGRTASIP